MEFARHVRARCPGVSLLLASANEPPTREHSPFDAFFIKPYQPEDIVTWIRQKKEIQIDVVLTDIEMPGAMNGFAFAKWARSMRPELDIVLAGTPERTAHAAGELCEHGPILTKP